MSPFAFSGDKELKGLMRVTDEMKAAQHTATDLIGTVVYDKLGEKVGEITDIGLSKDFAEKVQKAWREIEEDREMVPRKDIGVNVVYINVGSIMGMGGNTVSVPTSLLQYNSDADRIEIEYLRESVAAFADEGDSMVTSAKQDFYDAAESVEQAISNNAMLKSLQDKIDVSVEDGKLILRGELANQKMIDAVGDLAKKHTNLDIRNYIEVAN